MKPIEWTSAEREAVCEAVAVHTPELVALAPDGVSEGQHLYCVQCGVLPVDALALQHGPEHVAEHVAIALAPFVAERERQAAARALYHASDVAKGRASGDVSWLTLRAMAYSVRAGES